jgi:hypothetical protein
MNIQIVCASHSDAILSANLRRSPLLADTPLHVEKDAPSAAVAYNRALQATTADIVVFAHHDVYLPAGWDRLLQRRLRELPADWAVFGAFGIGLDGNAIGPVWSSSLGGIVGQIPSGPVPVQSYDEMLLVLRRDSGLVFDESLPEWHMYGTDIAQIARAAGRGAYCGALPTVHNDRFHPFVGDDFIECYHFMRRKWAGVLPISTPITKISTLGLHLIRDRWHFRKSRKMRAAWSVETDMAVELLAERCGWATLG